MKRDSKGQRVRTFKHFVPQPDLSTIETQVAVYFKADTSYFSIYDGAHMRDACKGEVQKSYDLRELAFFDDRVSSQLFDRVVEGFKALCTAYTRLLREAKKDRVIRFTFKRNLDWAEGRKAANDISFCEAPALHLDYEVLWRVAGKLYEQNEPGDPLQYRGSAADETARRGDGRSAVIEWTDEREAFFRNMRTALEALIQRVEAFGADLAANVDIAIAGNAPALLAPPQGEDAPRPRKRRP